MPDGFVEGLPCPATFSGIMPPTFRSTLIAMQEDRQDQHWLSRFALPVSLGLHLIIVALLVFGLPRVLQKPQNDEAVSVDLVPPPETPPKPKTEPPAETEKPQAKKPAEASPPPKEAPTQQPPAPSVSPVVQFGEKDAGPRKSLDGSSAEEAAKPPAPQKAPNDQTPARQDAPPMPEKPAPDEETVLSLPDAAETPTPRPTEAPREPKAQKLDQAKTLFSRSATGDALAMTAMGDLPRGVRGGTLCVTELRAQLLNASPPFFPDLLPSYQLQEGTVIDAPSAAFRAEGQWQEVGFRCEVDANATKVVSFAFRIGEPIPRSEWKQRGLPSQ